MVELITLYFSHSSNPTVSHTGCSHVIYTKPVTIYTLFTRFNYACKVKKSTQKVLSIFSGQA